MWESDGEHVCEVLLRKSHHLLFPGDWWGLPWFAIVLFVGKFFFTLCWIALWQFLPTTSGPAFWHNMENIEPFLSDSL